MFIWQKNGVVRIFHDGNLHKTPFIDLSAQVNTYDDRGLIGFAFDPGFAENGYVYLGFVYEPTGDTNSTAPRTSRLIRVTADPADPDISLPGSEVIIVDGLPASGSSHTLNTLRFAPDGTLFMSHGDAASAPSADPLALEAQSLDSYRGKILRILPDGSAPRPPLQVNPFYDGTDSIQSRIWAYGLRNPYRLDFHPVLNDLYLGDVGWNTWEELNRIIPGGNYGWPCFEGPLPQLDYQSTFPEICSLLSENDVVAPLATYDHSVGSAAVGGCFYTGEVYPADYVNSFFWFDYTGDFIHRLVLDSEGNLIEDRPFATGVGIPVAMEVGPDGLLYGVNFVSGEVWRLVFNGPVAKASATPASGYSPLLVDLSSSGSSDGLGRSITYQWDFGDGSFSSEPDPSHSFESGAVATFNVRLSITNTDNQTATTSVPITVGSLPPVPTISLPTAGITVEPGDTILYQGSATDPDDGDLPASALSWTILLLHNTHVHRFAGTNGGTGSFVAEEHGEGSYGYEIMLTATDSSGLQTSASTVLSVEDTTPPVVTLTAPMDGAEVFGTVSLRASVDDNGGVAGVQFLVDGSPLGAEDLLSPYSVVWDTRLVGDGPYSLTAQARDLAGNVATSAPVTVSVNNTTTTPTGLVAAYSFDEGLGTVLQDLSGNGNDGAIIGASWITGYDGQALSFNGQSDVVVVNDSASLHLTDGMTIEVWVMPTQSLSSWKAIAQKESNAYFLNGSTVNNRVGMGGTFGGACCTVLEAPSGLPVNQWTHVAGTYDGATARLYVDGVEVASMPLTGSLEVTGTPLRIGGNTYNEFFPGLIDNLRIYNRALSPTEIQQDMVTPVGGGSVPPPDTTAPALSGGLPTGVLAAGTTEATLELSTDEAATCRYDTVAGTPYAAMFGVFSSSGSTAHATLVTGLFDGQDYTYYVRCEDAAANANTSDFAIEFSIAPRRRGRK